jgi:hypothetical protein
MNDTISLVETTIARARTARVGLSIVVPVYRGATTVGRLVEALSDLHPAGGLEAPDGATWGAASPTGSQTGCWTSRRGCTCRPSAARRQWWWTRTPATAAPIHMWMA